MVRLKAETGSITNQTLVLFQFLHGTIKGLLGLVDGRVHKRVSIPTWYD